MKFWAVSDIHSDFADNLSWCQNLSDTKYSQDTLILAGDVTDSSHILRTTLACLASKWKHVFFTPGNHDLWLRGREWDDQDSLGKLESLRALCNELGVYFEPAEIAGVWVVPLLSWYHASFDREPDFQSALPAEKVFMDFQACSWSSQTGLNAIDTSLAAHLDSLNDPACAELVARLDAAQSRGARPPVITFSHFLPLPRLLPSKMFLHQPSLAKACGSDFLAARINVLKPAVHVFGHTHIKWDATINAVRYVQWPLGYPRESRRAIGDAWEPLVIYNSDRGPQPHSGDSQFSV